MWRESGMRERICVFGWGKERNSMAAWEKVYEREKDEERVRMEERESVCEEWGKERNVCEKVCVTEIKRSPGKD